MPSLIFWAWMAFFSIVSARAFAAFTAARAACSWRALIASCCGFTESVIRGLSNLRISARIALADGTPSAYSSAAPRA